MPARRQAGRRESAWWSWGRRLHGEGNRTGRHQRGAAKSGSEAASWRFLRSINMQGFAAFFRWQREAHRRPGTSASWMTRDLPITPAGRMMEAWQHHPLSRESPSSPESAGGDRAFATCVFGSRTFLKCSLPGHQKTRFLLTTPIWSGKTSARASSMPPSISTIPSSSDRRMTCGSSSTLSCHLHWHGF